MNGGKFKTEFLNKFFWVTAAVLISIILTQDFVFTFSPLKELELKLIDKRFLERGKIDLGDSSKVVIVEITQDLYDQIPPPNNLEHLPRFIYAKAIQNLTKAGAKVIGIDVSMSDPDKYSAANDTELENAIKKFRNVVVAGKIDEVWESQKSESGRDITYFNDSTYKKKKYNYENIFYDADSSLGIVQVPPDFDQVFRRYLPFRKTDITNKRVPSFGFALVSKYLGRKGTDTASVESDYFVLGGKRIPRFDRSSVLINFYGPSRTFPHVKLIDVIDDMDFKTNDEINYGEEINSWDLLRSEESTKNIFKDKVVIIGSTMPEDRDLLACSFAKGERKGDNLIYGVEFHANIVQNILSGNFLSQQSKSSEIILLILIAVISFYSTSALRKIKKLPGFLIEIVNLIISVALIYGIYKLSFFLFIHSKIVAAIVSPSLTVVIGYFSSTAYHFIKERHQNVVIKGMFSQYVNKDVVNELIGHPEKLRLGGERKNITILFSDIAGFTTFAENKSPEELVRFINEYLNAMTDLVLQYGGTLDKYLGDAVMAFWGAPIETDDHAFNACLTALKMQEKLAEMRDLWSASGEVQIRIRIGINTGDVIVGNIGGEKRFDYTVLGDDVNLASRLEGANKEYGTNIMIGESTYEACKEKILARELDIIRVKGKKKPAKVFELISIKGDEKAEKALEEIHLYQQAIELYRLRSFDAAHDYFKRSFEKLSDYPSKVYMQRCEFYMKNPPDQNWDGVFEMKTK